MKVKKTDEELVAEWMDRFDISVKPAYDAVRNIIKKSDKRIKERIKWNAPSYYWIEDIVTFGPYRKNKIVLVFHHPAIVTIQSALLEGDYKDRRLVWLESQKQIAASKKEITRIVKEIVAAIDAKQKS